MLLVFASPSSSLAHRSPSSSAFIGAQRERKSLSRLEEFRCGVSLPLEEDVVIYMSAKLLPLRV